MMRSVAVTLALATLVAVPAFAQVRGVPPGQLPPAGQCRVWYDGRPPGQQPPPTNCRSAERIASRDRYARVIYGAGTRQGRDDGWWERRDGDVVAQRRFPYPGRATGYDRVAFDNGYKDGYDKGREDARDNDRFDPVRHDRYRSADHGYESRYGSKDEYRNIYRDGFRAGYDDGYREARFDRR